jgi:N-acetylglucosaminyldiphosphoundecaprenol N-acetyl-beta-D-mannosaminyltransferase
MIDLGKKNLLGIKIDAVDYEAAVARTIQAAKEGRSYTCTALAVHGVMTGALDPVHRHRLNKLDMIVPDGMPVRWGLNWLHKARLPDRVYGPKLMLRCCEAAAEEGLPIFLFGTDASTLEKLSSNLKAKFPDLKIAGSAPSQFRRLNEVEAEALVQRIRDSQAKLAFVGLGCPRQEIWAYELGRSLPMPVYTIGAAFQFHAGNLAQAPAWMQNAGLEWLFRFLVEPRRLWKRYVYYNPAYLALLAAQWTGLRRVNPDDAPAPTERMLYG